MIATLPVTLRTITVRQPWAHAIPHGKNIENRSRGTRHRGPIGIHAGKAWSTRGAVDRRVVEALSSWVREDQVGLDPDSFRRLLDFGVLLAVADLVDTHPAAGCCQPWGEERYPDAAQLWHWVLERVRPLVEPIPMAGQLGLWNARVPADQLPAGLFAA